MAGNEAPFCTDEEILDELEKLGYSDVSPEIFHMMKKDLMDLVSNENSYCENLGTDTKSYSQSEVLKTPRFLTRETDEVLPLHDINTNMSSSFHRNRYIRRKMFSPENFERGDTSDRNLEINNFPSINRHFPGSKMGESNSHTFRSFDNSSTKIPLLLNQNRLPSVQLSDNGENFESTYKSVPYLYDRSQISSNSTYSPRIDERYQTRRPLSVVKESEKSIDNPAVENYTSEFIPKPTSISKYKDSLKRYKSSNRSKLASVTSSKSSSMADLESVLSCMSIDGKLKRKVLRHKNGKPTVTEELVDIPNIFNSSYPETTLNSSKSFVNNDVSFKSNSSTGSLVALSPETSLTPRSTFSLSTSRSRPANPQRKKKSDPVTMYNYYKKFWNNFKPPGEKTHEKLRWAVRDRMLDYSL